MAQLTILHMDDPVLKKTSKKISRLSPEILQLAEDMIETMSSALGLGLAAPQVGQKVRLITVAWDDGPAAYANPKIVKKWGQMVEDEGCLSLPGYIGTVERFEGCTVHAQELPSGQWVEIEVEGLMAKCFQHEVDHLNGIRYVDRVLPGSLRPYTPPVMEQVEEEDDGDEADYELVAVGARSAHTTALKSS